VRRARGAVVAGIAASLGVGPLAGWAAGDGVGSEGPTADTVAQEAPAGASRQGPPAAASGRFRALTGRDLTVYYAEGDSALAAAYRDFLVGQPPLPGLPDTIPSGVRAYLTPDRAVFDSLLGGRVPEWSAGVALPDQGVLVIPGGRAGLAAPSEAAGVLRHEWAHLGLAQWLEGLRPPRWFDEGYAQWAAGWDAGEAWRLRVALATGGTPPLDSLSLRWPRGRARAEAAYLLSATVLEYLVSESGERGLRLFLERWRREGSFESALRDTYGLSSGQLEEAWRDWLEGRYGWLYVLSHSAVFWLLLGGLLLVMVRIRKRFRTERMAELRADEPPDDPAWWSDESR